MKKELFKIIKSYKRLLYSYDEVLHYFNHNEYEMALEGFLIEIMDNNLPIVRNKKIMELVKYYNLDRETVFDFYFYQKFLIYLNEINPRNNLINFLNLEILDFYDDLIWFIKSPKIINGEYECNEHIVKKLNNKQFLIEYNLEDSPYYKANKHIYNYNKYLLNVVTIDKISLINFINDYIIEGDVENNEYYK